jgi:hypothetical protein
MPAVGAGRLEDAALRRWLARSDLRRLDAPRELLSRILGVLGLPYPESGLGALRMWGQTGERPTVWIAAADPVYLEPRLDHLCLHAQDAEDVPPADLRALIDHLQATVADSRNLGFARLGSCGYLCAQDPIATSDSPPEVVHLDLPNEYMPAGKDADRYRSLVSEVEMALHDHEVNLRRQAQGLQPINCLWIWGGGYAPEPTTAVRPPLFANDPLLTGHWLSTTGAAEPWPGGIAACVDAAETGFVAVIPEHDDPRLLASSLQELRGLLGNGGVDRLVLMFRDGIEAFVERGQRWRFWRRDPEFIA